MNPLLPILRAAHAALQDARVSFPGPVCPAGWDVAEDEARRAIADAERDEQAPEYDPSTGRLTCPHCGHAAHVREWTLIEGSHARIYRLRRFKSGAIEAYDEQHTDDSTQDFRIAHNPTAVCSREMPAPAALVAVLKWEED